MNKETLHDIISETCAETGSPEFILELLTVASLTGTVICNYT